MQLLAASVTLMIKSSTHVTMEDPPELNTSIGCIDWHKRYASLPQNLSVRKGCNVNVINSRTLTDNR